MNRYWNAKIETKLAKNKNTNEKEKRLFQIKITGINDQNSPFKIKTQRNDELFTKEFSDYFKSQFNLDDQLDQYLKCAYHGRNKRISLYVIGCETYTGLLILDENLYSLIPINSSKPLTYRIELIASTVKYYTASDEDFKSLEPTQPFYQTNNSTSINTLDLVINLDKRFIHNLNSDVLLQYCQNLILKCHLTWSYYYYEHQLKLQFKQLLIDYFTDSDFIPRRHTSFITRKLFNIDPLLGTNKFQFKSLFDTLVYKHKNDHLNQINIYSVWNSYLNETFIRLDGLATQSTYKQNCDLNQQASLVLLKNKFNPNETNKFKQFTSVLEESNVLIDLIGVNLGNQHRLNNVSNCQSDEYNWYFQVHSIQSNEEQLSSELDDLNTSNDLCLNRVIKINSNGECNQILKEISVVKEPTCGNGILEDNEQCDCGTNDLKCLNCCNVKTCKFINKNYECSNGECCDQTQCKLKSKTTMCRSALGDLHLNQTQTACDWAEYCDGESSKCPENKYHHNGIECTDDKNESGLCWHGQCISSNQQCKTYWSFSATNSDKSCYNNFNTIGFENGNCGVSLNETKKVYKQCEKVDSQCGLLQCQQGSNEPLIKSESYFKSTTSQKGQNYECKSITNQPSVYVLDGTKCDHDSQSGVCIKQKCIPLDQILHQQANKCVNPFKKNHILCSNNGVCDNHQVCHCFQNWSGKFCDQFTQIYSTKSIQSTTNLSVYSNLKTSSLISIICGLSILLFILLFIMYLFCRRCINNKRKHVKTNKPIKKSLSRSLIEFDNDYKVAQDYPDCKKETIFTSFKKIKSDMQTSTRANSIASLNNTNEITNSFINSSTTPNDCSISLTKVNHAIQQLNSQPAKSILKKVIDPPVDQNSSNLTDDVNASLKFERQVNRNTMLNAAIGNGHRTSRRSLIYDPKRASVCSSSSTSSSSSSISLSSASSESISSSLSKSNKLLNTKTLNQNSSSSESISSIVLQEPTKTNTLIHDSSKSDFLKVQDYLNELNILSKQNQFNESTRNSKEINDSENQNQSPMKPISLLLNSYQTKLTQNRLDEQKLIETPQRPSSLLTTVFVNNNNNKLNETRCVSSLTSPTQMLHLHISKHQNLNYDESNLLTNSSETSSGYMSNSTTNLHQPFRQNQQQQTRQKELKKLDSSQSKQMKNFPNKNSSRESLFETDDYYSIENKFKPIEQVMSESNSTSSRSSSSALTPPPPPLPKLTSPCETIKSERSIDKRFSYILATASSNNLNIS